MKYEDAVQAVNRAIERFCYVHEQTLEFINADYENRKNDTNNYVILALSAEVGTVEPWRVKANLTYICPPEPKRSEENRKSLKDILVRILELRIRLELQEVDPAYPAVIETTVCDMPWKNEKEYNSIMEEHNKRMANQCKEITEF